MRFSREPKLVRMVPNQKITNATVSSKTAGSGGVGSKGTADTLGYDRALIEVHLGTGTSKMTKFHLAFLSQPAFLMASGTLFSGRTSGIVLSAKLNSGVHLIDVNLANHGVRKRYMGCKITMSTTSSPVTVLARLYKAEQFPAGTTAGSQGYTTVTNFG